MNFVGSRFDWNPPIISQYGIVPQESNIHRIKYSHSRRSFARKKNKLVFLVESLRAVWTYSLFFFSLFFAHLSLQLWHSVIELCQSYWFVFRLTNQSKNPIFIVCEQILTNSQYSFLKWFYTIYFHYHSHHITLKQTVPNWIYMFHWRENICLTNPNHVIDINRKLNVERYNDIWIQIDSRMKTQHRHQATGISMTWFWIVRHNFWRKGKRKCNS